MMHLLPPGIILLIGALLVFITRGTLQRLTVLAVPLITLGVIWGPAPDGSLVVHLAGIDLRPYHLHPFTRIFATAFALAAWLGGIFGLRRASTLEMTAGLMSAASAVAITFAGDLITLFIFWELLAVASLVLIWCGRTERSGRAGLRYAYMHFLGGVLLLSGLAAHLVSGGSLALAPFEITTSGALTAAKIAPWLVLMGVLVNAAAPPFSAWLPDSYPESSASGMVLLSAFTTKTAVFVLLTLFAGSKLLVVVGLIMVFYGIFYAMLENDMRRILAYSIINQVGFMVTAIGIGTELAQYGAAAHAFCHILYKALLIMSAGSVLTTTGKSKCTELGGLYRTMPLTTFCGIIGAISISAFPLTSGFVSKSLISSAAGDQMVVWLLLTAASAGVFLHAGIKFPWFVFFQKDSGLRPPEAPIEMRAAMLLAVFGCIIPGMAPEWFYQILPGQMVNYVPYTLEHVITQMQLLLFSALAFFLLLPLMRRTDTISLDLDWFYRRPLAQLVGQLNLLLTDVMDAMWMLLAAIRHYISSLGYYLAGNRQRLAGNWGLSASAFLMAGLLALFLLIYLAR
jgi:multicomponent Na+:H+ antiporter subunit D